MKYALIGYTAVDNAVAPARERGLKLLLSLYILLMVFRRSREGAWIEIAIACIKETASGVAPARERGLKSKLNPEFIVDNPVAPARERGLKCYYQWS